MGLLGLEKDHLCLPESFLVPFSGAPVQVCPLQFGPESEGNPEQLRRRVALRLYRGRTVVIPGEFGETSPEELCGVAPPTGPEGCTGELQLFQVLRVQGCDP